jgi:hypothetical protein
MGQLPGIHEIVGGLLTDEFRTLHAMQPSLLVAPQPYQTANPSG